MDLMKKEQQTVSQQNQKGANGNPNDSGTSSASNSGKTVAHAAVDSASNPSATNGQEIDGAATTSLGMVDPESLLQFKPTSMSAPVSLSIDTTTTISISGAHPSMGHKVATPFMSHAFTTSPSITSAKTSHLYYSKEKPLSPLKSVSPTTSVASSTDSSASSGVKLMVSNMVLRKRESIAFFIDLLSPDSMNLKATKYSANDQDSSDATSPRSPTKNVHLKIPELLKEDGGDSEDEMEGGSSPVKGGTKVPFKGYNSTYQASSAPLQPPVLVSSDTAVLQGDDIINQKLTLEGMNEKQKPSVEIDAQIGKSISFPKIRSHSLRPAAKELQSILESRMTSATLKRAKILQARSQKLFSHAQSIKVKLLIHDSRQRLENLRMQARLEYNFSNAQLNRQVHLRKVREKFSSRVEYAKRIMLIQKMKKFVELRRALSENFLDLLRLNDDLDNEDEEAQVLTRKDIMNSLGLSVSIDENKDSDEENEVDKNDEKGDRWPIPDSPEKKSSNSDKAKNSKDFSRNFLFASSPGPRESLADRIKRTKSMPDLILKDASFDSTIHDLLTLLPPVTRFTLRELEMDEILSNMQLRHDIVFDPDLQFKASDADDCEAMEKSKAYWAELQQEVDEGHLYRICLLLSEVRAIMIELIPNGMEIKEEIYSHIDTHLISQQIEHGVMDPSHLIGYIAGIMKTNCAPIRDKLVDRMVQECKEGKIVKCLEICFEILELMKLDYANHQLSRLRPYIIEHSVNYEWKYFKNQVESKQITLDSTIEWLKRNWEAYKAQVTGSPNPAYDLYPEAFIEIISQASKYSETEILPETLKMDLTRLITFYNSWQDITILSTILVVFKQAAGPKAMAEDIQEAKTSLWILLNDMDSTMSHISVQMASMAGKIRNHPFTATETTSLNTMTEKMLAPGSKLYELMQNRVRIHLVNGVAGQKINTALVTKQGLQAVQTEMEELVTKMVPISDLNRAVFAKLYAGILDDIKSESPTGNRVLFADD